MGAESSTSTHSPEGMGGLAKGLAIIEAFGQASSHLTVTGAAEAAGTSRASARRCLLTLAELGFLVHDGKHFFPTPRMLRLGASYLDAEPLSQLAQPHLRAARQALGESVSLAVLEDGWSLFVARAEAQHIVSTGVKVGARLPAYCSATGRVLLAGLTGEGLARYLAEVRLEPRTPKTPVETLELTRIVGQACIDQVAITDEELETGMRSIAVPVVDAQGATVAAMSASAFTGRVSLTEIRQLFQPILSKHANELGRLL